VNALLELGVFVLLVAATAVGLATAIRVAPVVSTWNEMGVKPWACDLCMTFWLTLIVVLVAVFVPYNTRPEALFAWMPSFALAYTWLVRINPMPETFEGLPDEPPTVPPSRVRGAETEEE